MSAPPPRRFEHLGGETVYHGRIVDVRIERYSHSDGEEATREVVRHPGAVAILAHDDLHVWLTRQPREAVGEPDMLEIPAGRLDRAGESLEAAARRELAEEVSLGAERMTHLISWWTAAGITDERVHLFHATGLSPASADSGEQERIEVLRWPLDELDGAIAQCIDSKTLIALQWLALRLRD
jgi:ADP-ribose pyrophosphatase